MSGTIRLSKAFILQIGKEKSDIYKKPASKSHLRVVEDVLLAFGRMRDSNVTMNSGDFDD